MYSILEPTSLSITLCKVFLSMVWSWYHRDIFRKLLFGWANETMCCSSWCGMTVRFKYFMFRWKCIAGWGRGWGKNKTTFIMVEKQIFILFHGNNSFFFHLLRNRTLLPNIAFHYPFGQKWASKSLLWNLFHLFRIQNFLFKC